MTLRSIFKLTLAASALALSLGLAAPASAQLKITLDQGSFEPLPIAVPDFAANGGEAATVGAQIASVVAADLERSGLFRPIPKTAFVEQIGFATTTPDFNSWKSINAAGLVVGNVVSTGPGKVKVSFRLWDVYGGTQIAGKQFDTFTRNYRRIAHLIADEIYKRVTGEEGYFDTRIVYVAESGPKKKRIKRLAIMDQDGENHKYLTGGENMVLTPRFSPNSQEILYFSYAKRIPKVYLRDLQTGREDSVGSFQGMSFAPRFNHDGSKMLMSIANNGTTDIYEMNLRSRSMKRLTNSSGDINTSPSYSPDGRSIVFTSDRGGSQQLYTMDASGGSVKRISFGKGNYSTPVWSPRGDYIAYTLQGGGFSIGVMRADGSGERTLTSSWLAEGPTWAPNGRVIMFNRQSGPGAGVKLYSIDITGRNLRQVPTPMDATDPAWSPLLPL